MRKLALYKELDLETVNLEGLFKEIKDRRSSGYFKISYLDSDDYIFYAEGEPVYGVSYDNKGLKKSLSYENYELKNKKGVISFFEIPLVYVFAFKYRDLEIPTPYTFVPLGSEVLSVVKLSHVDIGKVLELIKRSYINGYMIVLNNKGYKFMLILDRGSIVCSYDGTVFKRQSFQRFAINSEDFVATFSMEPEIPIFLSSMDRIVREKGGIFKSGEGLERIRKLISSEKISGILGVYLSNGDVGYEFFYQGISIKSVLWKREEVMEGYITIEPNTNNKYEVFKIDLVKPRAVEVDFVFVESDSEQESLSIVPESKVMMLKTIFTEEIGPVGPLLWNKILKEQGYKESKMSMEHFEKLVQILHKEIPDLTHANKFLEKVRRLMQ